MARPKKYSTEEERIKARNKNARSRYAKNPEKFKKAQEKCLAGKPKNYYYNAEKKKQYKKNYIDKGGQAKINEARKKREAFRKKQDAGYKFKCTVKTLISGSFKRGNNIFRKSSTTENILGCSLEFFRDYILSKCPKGTTVKDFHRYGYHIDHIVPISLATTKEEVISLNHYTNLQPLFSKDNLQKSNKILNFEL